MEGKNLIYSAILPTITKKRLSKDERSQFKIESPLSEIIIGLLLGDGHIQNRSSKGISRFIFGQSSKKLQHLNYFYHILDLFKPYISKDFTPKNRTTSAVKIKPASKSISLQDSSSYKGELYEVKSHSSVYFATYSLPCFNYFENLFYTVDPVKAPPLKVRTGKTLLPNWGGEAVGLRRKIVPVNIEKLLTPIGLAY